MLPFRNAVGEKVKSSFVANEFAYQTGLAYASPAVKWDELETGLVVIFVQEGKFFGSVDESHWHYHLSIIVTWIIAIILIEFKKATKYYPSKGKGGVTIVL